MSSQRFPLEGAIGTIRAHEQAAIDHFLMFAERERQRLESNVIEAEMQCREADAQLAEATAENARVAEQLFATWQELQAERERAEQAVSHRLSEVHAEAQELTQWSESRPGYGPQRHAMPAESAAMPVSGWAPAYASAPASGYGDGPDATAAAAFFEAPGSDDAAWSTIPTAPNAPTVHDELLARHPRRQNVAPPVDSTAYMAAPVAPPAYAAAAAAPPVQAAWPEEAPVDASVPPVQPDDAYPDFWKLEQAAATLRAGQLEGTLSTLLPMLALVIVLVVVLAWIG